MPGALHHVMARGLNREAVFLGVRDRADFVRRLAALVEATGVILYAWALVPNHFHLLVETGRCPLSELMRRLLTGYAVTFNHRHGRVGHLFQNRYKSILVEREPYFLELVRYIHLNPVRAGLVPDLGALDRHPWTGHAALMGLADRPWQDRQTVLAEFGPEPGDAVGRYREFVAAGLPQGRRDELSGGGLVRSSGGACFVAGGEGRGRERWAWDERVLGSGPFVEEAWREVARAHAERPGGVPPGCGVEQLVEEEAGRRGLKPEEVRGRARNRAVLEVRCRVARVAVREWGLSPTAVAKELKLSRQAVLRALSRAGMG